jgi:hypothetical protein
MAKATVMNDATTANSGEFAGVSKAIRRNGGTCEVLLAARPWPMTRLDPAAVPETRAGRTL